MSWKIYVHQQPWYREHVDILITKLDGGDGDLRRKYVVEPLRVRPWTEADDAVMQQPTIRLPVEQAQQLMDRLWDCGLRPSEGSGSAGALAATERHLKDMQSISFQLLNEVSTPRPENGKV